MPSSLIRLLFAFSVVWSVPAWCGRQWIFEPNVGQTATPVRFLGRAGSSAAYVTPSEVVLSLRGGQDVLRLRFPGAESRPVLEGADPLPGKTNYLTGAVRRTGIPQFGRVRYTGLYQGIDLVLYGGEEGLEYDFEVGPGADPQAIALKFEGAATLTLDDRGDLLIAIEGGEVRQRRPRVYQKSGGDRTQVSCDYVLMESGEVRLKLGPYDRKARLVIDPVLALSVLMGGTDDRGQGMTVDSEGNAYVVGTATSTAFPTTPGAFSRTRKGESCGFGVFMPLPCTDVFVSKFSRQGDLLYSTYIGGTQVDYGYGIAVDAAGNAYVTGSTKSPDFPVTAGAFQGAFRGATCTYDPSPGPPFSYPCDDAFVLKLNPSGSALVYATYLAGGGSDTGRAIIVDRAGNATVVGHTDSADFPLLPAPPQPANSAGAFITKLNPSGGALLSSTILVGAGASAAAADPFGNLYIVGSTYSAEFPYTPGAFLGPSRGNLAYAADAFVAKFSDRGGLIYAARIGGVPSSLPLGIAVDSQGSAYVTGTTASDDFPVTASPSTFRSFPGGGIFLAKLDPQGSTLSYSLRIGGKAGASGVGVAVDGGNNAYVLGQSDSVDFPVTAGAILPCATSTQWQTARTQAVLFKISASGTTLMYSTYLSLQFPLAVAVDADDNQWLTGWIGSQAFVAKVDFSQSMERKVTCVASAASLLSGPVSPGELVAVFGVGLGPEAPAWLTLNSGGKVSTELAGVRVLFDAIPAPLIYVQANQINAVVPFGVSGKTSTQVEVEYQGQKTAPVSVPVTNVTPAVFTLDSSGAGQGVILNENGTVNTPQNPAPEGSTIAMWATGAGLMDSTVSDGQVTAAPYPRPQLPVRVQVNLMDQEVTYAGAAPGMVAGVLQVNVKIAFGAKRPHDVLSLAVGDKWSPWVSLSIK